MSWDKRSRNISIILAELTRAEQLFPKWPTYSVVEAAAIVAEEAGEALKAALNMRPGDPHKGTYAELRKELIQTGAMVLRMLENLPEVNDYRD